MLDHHRRPGPRLRDPRRPAGVDLARIARTRGSRPRVRPPARARLGRRRAARASERTRQELRRPDRAPCAVARAAGGPGRLLRCTAASRACPRRSSPAGGPASVGCRPRREESADCRRRHPQHLRADERAGGARHDRGVGGQRPRRAAHHGRAGADRHRADGHHDARDGRHRHHAGGAQDPSPRPADHRRDGQGHEGRPRALHRGRAPGTTCRSRSTRTICWPCCAPGCIAERAGSGGERTDR